MEILISLLTLKMLDMLSSLYIDWYQSRGYEEIYSSLPILDFLQIEIVKAFPSLS